MIVLTFISVFLLILTYIAYGGGLVFLASSITTAMFLARKFGLFAKPKYMLTIECLILFLSVVLHVMLKNVSISKIVLLILVRAMFYALVLFDTTQYVYVKEVHRKEDVNDW